MQQRDATKYPATNELFGVSVYTASRIDRVKVMQDPLGGRVNPVHKKADRGRGEEGQGRKGKDEEKGKGEDEDEGKED